MITIQLVSFWPLTWNYFHFCLLLCCTFLPFLSFRFKYFVPSSFPPNPQGRPKPRNKVSQGGSVPSVQGWCHLLREECGNRGKMQEQLKTQAQVQHTASRPNSGTRWGMPGRVVRSQLRCLICETEIVDLVSCLLVRVLLDNTWKTLSAVLGPAYVLKKW